MAARSELRRVYAMLAQEAERRFPTSQGIGNTVLGAFFFLRMVCPAVLNPKLFGLALCERPGRGAAAGARKQKGKHFGSWSLNWILNSPNPGVLGNVLPGFTGVLLLTSYLSRR